MAGPLLAEMRSTMVIDLAKRKGRGGLPGDLQMTVASWNRQHPEKPKGLDGRWVDAPSMGERDYTERFGLPRDETTTDESGQVTLRQFSDGRAHFVNDRDDEVTLMSDLLDDADMEGLRDVLEPDLPSLRHSRAITEHGVEVVRGGKLAGGITVWPMPNGGAQITRSSDGAMIADLDADSRMHLFWAVDDMVKRRGGMDVDDEPDDDDFYKAARARKPDSGLTWSQYNKVKKEGPDKDSRGRWTRGGFIAALQEVSGGVGDWSQMESAQRAKTPVAGWSDEELHEAAGHAEVFARFVKDEIDARRVARNMPVKDRDAELKYLQEKGFEGWSSGDLARAKMLGIHDGKPDSSGPAETPKAKAPVRPIPSDVRAQLDDMRARPMPSDIKRFSDLLMGLTVAQIADYAAETDFPTMGKDKRTKVRDLAHHMVGGKTTSDAIQNGERGSKELRERLHAADAAGDRDLYDRLARQRRASGYDGIDAPLPESATPAPAGGKREANPTKLLADRLRQMDSARDAREAIAGLKVAELKALATELGLRGSQPSKQAWRNEIVYYAVIGPRTLARAAGDEQPNPAKGRAETGIDQLAAKLQHTEDATEARKWIAGLKVAELKALATALGIRGSQPTKKAWQETIFDATVQNRLNSAAIRGGVGALSRLEDDGATSAPPPQPSKLDDKIARLRVAIDEEERKRKRGGSRVQSAKESKLRTQLREAMREKSSGDAGDGARSESDLDRVLRTSSNPAELRAAAEEWKQRAGGKRHSWIDGYGDDYERMAKDNRGADKEAALESLTNRVGAMKSEAEIIAALSGESISTLRQVAERLGGPMPKGLKDAPAMRAHIARAQVAFGEPVDAVGPSGGGGPKA